MADNNKWIWVITGPNGAGKSYLHEHLPEEIQSLPYINPDVVAATIAKESEFATADLADIYIEARKRNKLAVDNFKRTEQSFAIEMGIPSGILAQKFEALKAEGWNIGIVAVGVELETAQARVEQRVKEGGHDVQALTEIFSLCRRYTPIALGLADQAYIYDNNGAQPLLVATKASAEAPITIITTLQSDYLKQIVSGNTRSGNVAGL